MKLAQIFPDRPPEILDIASRLRSLVLEIFPDAVESHDEENLGFGFGEGYKLLVFVISPQSDHVNLGIAGGAGLADPKGLMEGRGKVHRHIKVRRVAQIDNPDLKGLMVNALRAARVRTQKCA